MSDKIEKPAAEIGGPVTGAATPNDAAPHNASPEAATPDAAAAPGSPEALDSDTPKAGKPGADKPAGEKVAGEKVAKVKRPQQVYTLIIEVGRKAGDGLPAKATGAALMCYASGVDEAEAVRETVAILKDADLSPLEVQGLGTLDERRKSGDEIGDDEIELMDRALAENSVVVAQMTPFYD